MELTPQRTLAKGAFTITETEDISIRVEASTTNFLITTSSDLSSFNFSNAKTKLMLWVGGRPYDSKYLKVGLISNSQVAYNNPVVITSRGNAGGSNYTATYGVTYETQTVEVDGQEVQQFTGLVKITSFALEGLSKAELISSSFDLKVSLTDEALQMEEFKSFADYYEIISLSWNMMPAGASGYAVNLSRGTNCIIYSDSLNAAVTQAQLDSMLNKITASSYEYDLTPFLGNSEDEATNFAAFSANPQRKFYVQLINQIDSNNLQTIKNCTVDIVSGQWVRVKSVAYEGDGISGASADKTVAWYTVRVYCESATKYFDYQVTISKVLPKEDLLILGDQAFIYDSAYEGTPAPSSITLSVMSKWTSQNYVWSYAPAGTSIYTDIPDPNSDRYTDNSHTGLIVTPTSPEWANGVKSVTYRVYANGTYDYKTVFKVSGGANAYTVFLTNQQSVLPCDEHGTIMNPDQVLTTQVMVLKGSSVLNYWYNNGQIVGDRISNHANTYTIIPSQDESFTIDNTTGTIIFPTSVATQQEVTEIPITIETYDGGTFNLVHKIYKSRQGIKGDTGDYGLSAVLSNESYLVQCDEFGQPLTGAFNPNYCFTELTVYKGADNITWDNHIANANQKVVVTNVTAKNVLWHEDTDFIQQQEGEEEADWQVRRLASGKRYYVDGWMSNPHDNSDTGYISIECQIHSASLDATHVSAVFRKTFNLTKVRDGKTGDIAIVYHLKVDTNAIAVMSGNEDMFTPSKVTAESVVIGRENVNTSLPLLWQVHHNNNSDQNLIPCSTVAANLIIYPLATLNLKSLITHEDLTTEYQTTQIATGVKLLVDKFNKWIYIVSGTIEGVENITESQDQSMSFTVNDLGKVVDNPIFDEYGLYSAITIANPRLVPGTQKTELGVAVDNESTMTNEYYENSMKYLRVMMYSSRVSTAATILDEQSITYLMKDWTGIQIIATPQVMSVACDEFGSANSRDYTKAKSRLIVLNGELDVTSKCYFEVVNQPQGQNAGITGWAKDGSGAVIYGENGKPYSATSEMYCELTQTPQNADGGIVEVAVTYGLITQTITLAWDLHKQGLTGVPITYAGKWKRGKKYQLRSDRVTVVQWPKGSSQSNSPFYWYTRKLASGESPVIFPADNENIPEPGHEEGIESNHYWQEFGAEFESVATSFLFAEDAYINDLATAVIYIGDAYEHDANGDEKMDSNMNPITNYKGWAIDKDQIRSRSTAPTTVFQHAIKCQEEDGRWYKIVDGQRVYTKVVNGVEVPLTFEDADIKISAKYVKKLYYSDYLTEANWGTSEYKPATVLYSDGGLRTSWGIIGGWTINSDSLSHTVASGVGGTRPVIGMAVTDVWSHKKNFIEILVDYDTKESRSTTDEITYYSGQEILSKDSLTAEPTELEEADHLNATAYYYGLQNVDGLLTELNADHPNPDDEGYITFDNLTEDQITAYGQRLLNEIVDEDSDIEHNSEPVIDKPHSTTNQAEKTQKRSIFVQSDYLPYTDIFGNNQKKGICQVEMYYIDPSTFGVSGKFINAQKGETEIEYFHLGSYNKIAGWSFDENALYNYRTQVIKTTEGNLYIKYPEQGMFLYSKKFQNSGYDTAIEIFGGDAYKGTDISTAFGTDYTTNIRSTIKFAPQATTYEVGNETNIETLNLLNPQYVMKFGYEEAAKFGTQVTVPGGPVFRIARYYPETVWTPELIQSAKDAGETFEDEQALLGSPVYNTAYLNYGSPGRYVDLFKVDRNGAELGGWKFSKEGLYNRGRWETPTSFMRGYGMYNFEMVSGAIEGLPRQTLSANRVIQPIDLEDFAPTNINEIVEFFNPITGKNYTVNDTFYYASTKDGSFNMNEPVLDEEKVAANVKYAILGIVDFEPTGEQKTVTENETEVKVDVTRQVLTRFTPYDFASRRGDETSPKLLYLLVTPITIDASGATSIITEDQYEMVKPSHSMMSEPPQEVENEVAVKVFKGILVTTQQAGQTDAQVLVEGSGNGTYVAPIRKYTKVQDGVYNLKARGWNSELVYVDLDFEKKITYDTEGNPQEEWQDVMTDKRYGFVSNSISFGVEKLQESPGFFGLTDFDRAPYFRISHYDRVHDPNLDHQVIFSVDRDSAIIAGWNMTWDRFYRISPSIVYNDPLGTVDRKAMVLFYNENTRKFDTSFLKDNVDGELIYNEGLQTYEYRSRTGATLMSIPAIRLKVDANDNISDSVIIRPQYSAARNEFAIISTGEIHNITFVGDEAKAQRRQFINWALYPSGEAIFANGGLMIGHKNGIPYVSFGKSVETNISTESEDIVIDLYIKNETYTVTSEPDPVTGQTTTTTKTKKLIVADEAYVDSVDIQAFNAISAQVEDAVLIEGNNGQFKQVAYNGTNPLWPVGVIPSNHQIPANPYFIITKSDIANDKYAKLFYAVDPTIDAVIQYPWTQDEEGQLAKAAFENDRLPSIGQSYTIIYNLTYYCSDAVDKLDDAAAALTDMKSVATYHKRVVVNHWLDPNQIYFKSNKDKFVLFRKNTSQRFEQRFFTVDTALMLHDYRISGEHWIYTMEANRSNTIISTIDETHKVGLPELIKSENIGILRVGQETFTDDEFKVIEAEYLHEGNEATYIDYQEYKNVIINWFHGKYTSSADYDRTVFYLINPNNPGMAVLQYSYRGVNYTKTYLFEALAESAGVYLPTDLIQVPVSKTGIIQTKLYNIITKGSTGYFYFDVDFENLLYSKINQEVQQIIANRSDTLYWITAITQDGEGNDHKVIEFYGNDSINNTGILFERNGVRNSVRILIPASASYLKDYNIDLGFRYTIIPEDFMKISTDEEFHDAAVAKIKRMYPSYRHDPDEQHEDEWWDTEGIESVYESWLGSEQDPSFFTVRYKVQHDQMEIHQAWWEFIRENDSNYHVPFWTTIRLTPVFMHDRISRDSDISADWVSDWTTLTTYIDSNRILTPKIFAGTYDQNSDMSGVMMGQFKIRYGGLEKNVNGLVAVYQNKEYVNLNPNECRISGWKINDHQIKTLCNFDFSLDSQAGIELDSEARHIMVYSSDAAHLAGTFDFKDNTYVRMYVDPDESNWGLVGYGRYVDRVDYTYEDQVTINSPIGEVFHLGSYNQIAGWTITPNAISNALGHTGIRMTNTLGKSEFIALNTQDWVMENYWSIDSDGTIVESTELIEALEGAIQAGHEADTEVSVTYGDPEISYTRRQRKKYLSYVSQYITDSNDWGIGGYKKVIVPDVGTYSMEEFHLGSHNQIAGWNFDHVKMWKESNTQIEGALGTNKYKMTLMTDPDSSDSTDRYVGIEVIKDHTTYTPRPSSQEVDETHTISTIFKLSSKDNQIAGWFFNDSTIWKNTVFEIPISEPEPDGPDHYDVTHTLKLMASNDTSNDANKFLGIEATKYDASDNSTYTYFRLSNKGNSIASWIFTEDSIYRTLENEQNPTGSIGVKTADGAHWMWAGHADGSFEFGNGSMTYTKDGSGNWVLSFSNDFKHEITGDQPAWISVWSNNTAIDSTTIAAPRGVFGYLDEFSPNEFQFSGIILGNASGDNAVKIWTDRTYEGSKEDLDHAYNTYTSNFGITGYHNNKEVFRLDKDKCFIAGFEFDDKEIKDHEGLIGISTKAVNARNISRPIYDCYQFRSSITSTTTYDIRVYPNTYADDDSDSHYISMEYDVIIPIPDDLEEYYNGIVLGPGSPNFTSYTYNRIGSIMAVCTPLTYIEIDKTLYASPTASLINLNGGSNVITIATRHYEYKGTLSRSTGDYDFISYKTLNDGSNVYSDKTFTDEGSGYTRQNAKLSLWNNPEEEFLFDQDIRSYNYLILKVQLKWYGAGGSHTKSDGTVVNHWRDATDTSYSGYPYEDFYRNQRDSSEPMIFSGTCSGYFHATNTILSRNGIYVNSASKFTVGKNSSGTTEMTGPINYKSNVLPIRFVMTLESAATQTFSFELFGSQVQWTLPSPYIKIRLIRGRLYNVSFSGYMEVELAWQYVSKLWEPDHSVKESYKAYYAENQSIVNIYFGKRGEEHVNDIKLNDLTEVITTNSLGIESYLIIDQVLHFQAPRQYFNVGLEGAKEDYRYRLTLLCRPSMIRADAWGSQSYALPWLSTKLIFLANNN